MSCSADKFQFCPFGQATKFALKINLKTAKVSIPTAGNLVRWVQSLSFALNRRLEVGQEHFRSARVFRRP